MTILVNVHTDPSFPILTGMSTFFAFLLTQERLSSELLQQGKIIFNIYFLGQVYLSFLSLVIKF